MNEEKRVAWPAVLRVPSRLLYNHNPFYPISAALTLYGIHRTAGANVSLGGGLLVLELLCGYTAVLAVVGYLIARFGRVWDDARTILLIVALLLVALSAAFDRFLLVSPESGAIWLAIGGAFAVLVTEGILWGLRMRLAARYRVPYYLQLGLLFIYPYALAKLSKDGPDTAMPWAILLFPIMAAGVFFMLLPAARRDDRRGPPNGTPWRWPLYPWSLFTILLVAVELRSYSLGVTFEAGRGLASSFSSWFLIPLLFTAAALLLELALTAGNLTARNFALAMPLACLPLVLCRASCPQSEHFGQLLADAIASPPQLAAAAIGLFYLVAWLRGMRAGEFGVVLCLAFVAMIDRHAPAGHAFGHWQPAPLLVAAALEVMVAVRQRSSLRLTISLTALGLAAATVKELTPYIGSPEEYFWQINPLVALAVAAVFNDVFAKFVREVAWQWLPLVAIWITARSIIDSSPLSAMQLTYLGSATMLGGIFWYRDRGWPLLAAAMISGTTLAVGAGSWGLPAVEDSLFGPGLPWLAWGTAALWLAVLVSLGKSGTLARLLRAFQRFGDGRFAKEVQSTKNGP